MSDAPFIDKTKYTVVLADEHGIYSVLADFDTYDEAVDYMRGYRSFDDFNIDLTHNGRMCSWTI